MGKPGLIKVLKTVGLGLTNSTFPSYLTLGQRHFEKEKPVGINGDKGRYYLPLDFLAMSLPVGIVDQIESVEMVYREKEVGGVESGGESDK